MKVMLVSSPTTRTASRLPRSIHPLLLLVTGLIACAVCIALLLEGRSSQHSAPKLSDAEILVSAAALPAPAARISSGDMLSPLRIPQQGTATLYDEVRGSAAAYYLLSGPNSGQSTLYRQDLKKGPGLEQMSTSTSLKLELSVNTVANIAAYTAYDKEGRSTVTTFDLATGVEKQLGAGMHPTVLADGLNVIFMQNGALISMDLTTATSTKLLDLPKGASFAVNPHTSELAVFDPGTHVLQRYWIVAGMSELQPGLSTKLKDASAALFYSNDHLYTALQGQDAINIMPADQSGEARTLKAPGASLAGLRITAL